MLARAAVVWVIAFVVGQLAYVLLLSVAGASSAEDLTGGETFAASLPFFAVLLVGTLYLAGHIGREPARVLGLLPARWIDAVLGLGIGFISQFALIPLYVPLVWLFDIEVDESARRVADRFDGYEQILLALLVVVIAPVVEEMFFRGLVQNQLQKLVSPVIALVVASAIFAGLHFDLVTFVGLFFFGLIAGLLFQRRGLVAAIAAHAAFNGAALVGLIG